MEGKLDTVCIIDDDDIYQFTASIEIKKTQLVDKIIVFSNGEQAIDFFKLEINNATNLPDIIFLDVNMPVMDGWQFLDEFILFKDILPKTVLIYMVSSSVDERDISRANRIKEVTGYMLKPIGQKKMAEIFSSMLN
ncbi:MAG: response regulator [Cytophagales bacterium]